jgi:hypothetical protein
MVNSPEGKIEDLGPWTGKLDLEPSILDGFRLSDQLIQTRFDHRADAFFVDVDTVRRAWGLSIDQHAKLQGRSRRCRAHDEI